MNQVELSALLGVIVSLVFSYFPGVRDWFDTLEANVKRLIQVALAVIVAWVIFGLSCAGLMATFTCDWPGALEVLRLIVAFLVANQTAYAVSPRK